MQIKISVFLHWWMYEKTQDLARVFLHSVENNFSRCSVQLYNITITYILLYSSTHRPSYSTINSEIKNSHYMSYPEVNQNFTYLNRVFNCNFMLWEFPCTKWIGICISFLCVYFPIDGIVFTYFNSGCSSLNWNR